MHYSNFAEKDKAKTTTTYQILNSLLLILPRGPVVRSERLRLPCSAEHRAAVSSIGHDEATLLEDSRDAARSPALVPLKELLVRLKVAPLHRSFDFSAVYLLQLFSHELGHVLSSELRRVLPAVTIEYTKQRLSSIDKSIKSRCFGKFQRKLKVSAKMVAF